MGLGENNTSRNSYTSSDWDLEGMLCRPSSLLVSHWDAAPLVLKNEHCHLGASDEEIPFHHLGWMPLEKSFSNALRRGASVLCF